MDCTLIIPITVTKFSHGALKLLLAAQLGISGDIGVSCDWNDDATVDDPPRECVVYLPEGTTCDEIPADLFSSYAPVESDKEEDVRLVDEAKREEPFAKELLERISDLEAKVEALEGK